MLKVKEAAAEIIPIRSAIRHDGIVIEGGKGSGILAVKFDSEFRSPVSQFVKEIFAAKNLRAFISMEKWYKHRTLKQNNLMWALLRILSQVVYTEYGHEDSLYQDILDLYSPKTVSELTGKPRSKSSSDLNTCEMATVIEGIFYQIAENGCPVEFSETVKTFFRNWYVWRFEQKEDPLRYASEKEYRERVPYCEATLEYLGGYGTESYQGNIAHIVSKGSGGRDEAWNFLHLKGEIHIEEQHQHGWASFLATYPHLKGKVDRAMEMSGKVKPSTSGLKESVEVEPDIY
jgi:hypothetical protein